MARHNRERGGVPTPLLVAVLAVLIIGGTVFFLTSGPGAGHAQIDEGTTGFVPRTVQTDAPSFEKMDHSIPKLTPESEEILKGDLIKYHDHTGRVRFRTREPIAGVDAQGNTIYWQPSLTVGPALPRSKVGKQKVVKGGSKPPRLVMRNGRLQVGANPAGQQGGDQGKTEDG